MSDYSRTPAERAKDQSDRRTAIEAGQTVVANAADDLALIKWTKSEGLYVAIGRGHWTKPPNFWGNPFRIGHDGTRAEVCAKHKAHFAASPEKQARIGELKGKVLGCHCNPMACHGDHFKAMVDKA